MNNEKNRLNIKDLKSKAKSVIKTNLWTLLFVGVLMSTIFEEYRITQSSNNSLETVTKYIQTIKNGDATELISDEDNKKQAFKYIEEEINEALFGSKEGNVKDINEQFGVTHGIFYGIFDFVTNTKIQLKNFVNSFTNIESKLELARWIIILTSFLGLLVKILIVNPITVGENRVFLESRKYKETSIKRIVFGFTKKRHFKIVKSILRRGIYKALWDITIIGGIIKYYSYLMVGFIVAENPYISGKDAIKISREMMNGYKWEAFKLDLSFFGWHLLQVLTFGIIGFWVNTYIKAAQSELYVSLRENYIKDKKYGYELLNDDKLFNNNDLTKYPEYQEKEKKKINYNYNYRPSSIILFFFTFAFVGWLWEVLLYLFRDGVLVNRGTTYGPWLPIYGISCTAIILLVTRFKIFRKMTKSPLITFIFIMLFSTIVEYFGSWFIEITSGLKYWDYSGVFMNINGRVCLECSLFFGAGGSLCLYIVAPFLEKQFEKLTLKFRITLCLILTTLFTVDEIYSLKYPHQGEGITNEAHFERQNEYIMKLDN